jgi:hypothetical protein
MLGGYVDDAKNIILGSLNSLKQTKEYQLIFRVSLAADAVLSELSKTNLKPSLSAARSIVLRIPLLVGLKQTSVATIELRRFCELVFWSVYFTDHPIEWASFERSPSSGFVRDINKPINYCAHRELTFYSNYARELMADEPSGISVEAVDSLRQVQEELSAVVHPGRIASAKPRVPPFDDVSPDSLTKFALVQRQVFSRCCILLAAFKSRRFDRLQPMHRAHFDWIVGAATEKRIRQGPFGLP